MLEFKTGKLYKYLSFGLGNYNVTCWDWERNRLSPGESLKDGDIFLVVCANSNDDVNIHKILIRNGTYKLWVSAYNCKHFREVIC